ncbi:methyl-accepting chemotaxis protein [Clostridium sp.]|uniref:methyl-accepting chemotaxis protein n=1 Tax=Clostridium sp. TaxID=1506 RepID=UPI002FCC34B3
MFKSLKMRILTSFIVLTFVCTLIFTAVSIYQIRSAVTNQMKNDGTNLVTVINREIGKYDFNDSKKIETILKEVKSQSKENIKYISLADTDLKIIASSDNEGSQDSGESTDAVTGASEQQSEEVAGSIKEGKSSGYIFETETGEKVYNVSTAFYQGEKLVGTISIGISLNVMNDMITASLKQIIIIALIVQALAIVVGVIMAKRITKPITNVIDKLDDFAKGDFTVEFNSNRNDETKKLADALNQSIYIIKQMLREMKDSMHDLSRISVYLKTSSGNVENSSKIVSDSIQEVAQGICEQDSSMNHATKAIEKFSTSLYHIQEKVKDTTTSSVAIESTANVGAERLTELVKSIEDVRNSFGAATENIMYLNGDANKIGEIMSVINSVAEQTNLLALNAAIEAARAGEAGKGFSVVAEEIRKLAEQVMDSSRSINEITTGILTSVQSVSSITKDISVKMDNQMHMVDNTMTAFKNIQSEVNKTTPEFKNIFQAIKSVVSEEEAIMSNVEEVSAISEQISASTQEIASSVQEHASTMEELSNLSDKINDLTNRLNDNIDKFKI